MNIPFNSALFEMAMAKLGIAAGQLKSIDADAKKALFRFVFRAVQSGDANAYIKEALDYLEKRDEKPEPPPRPQPQPAYKATSRPIR